MKKFVVYFLRSFILCALFLPIFVPFVSKNLIENTESTVSIFLPSDLNLKPQEKLKIHEIVQSKFGEKVKLNYFYYGHFENSYAQDYENLLTQLNESFGVTFVLSSSHLFGDDALKFNAAIKLTKSFKEKRLFYLPLSEIVDAKKDPQEYLVLSDIFIPRLSFLNEESIVTVHLVGKSKPGSRVETEITLHSGKSFLNSKKVFFDVPPSGLIKESFEIPVYFTRPGSQVVTAEIVSALSQSPLNSASTFVQVVHSKTTLLHIAVGPDWSLRSLRQKLKFWPNLDLLSYYILREITSDQSIPNAQLSLIEFPVEKLFGENIANFHGIIAQNFLFDTYLASRDSENLVQYIKNGGRLFIQAGPLSFLSQSSFIKSLFPCENIPKWDFHNTYFWVPERSHFLSSTSFLNHLSHMMSHNTALGCIPKKQAIVLAKTKDSGHPVLLAMPLEKGIVLTFLAGDWLGAYTQLPDQNQPSKSSPVRKRALRMRNANSSEFLFAWVVEFLQRRQESGVRGPDLAGPRLYTQDRFLAVKNRGGLQLDKSVVLETPQKKSISGLPFYLKYLGKEMVELKQPVSFLSFDHFAQGGQSGDLVEIALGQSDQNKATLKFGLWPLFQGSSKTLEKLSNPFLFEGIPLPQKEFLDRESVIFDEKVPLLVAYPWILGASLFLLAWEQFLSRLVWREKL